jgi:predicted PurR-regulated permease PerM
MGITLFFRDVWMIAFFAAILACLLGFPVRFFSRFLPRGAATFLTLILILGIAFFAVPLLVRPLYEQAQQVEQSIPSALNKAKLWLNHIDTTSSSIPALSKSAITNEVQEKTQGFLSSLIEKVSGALLQATSFGATLALTFVLALFFVYEPNTYFCWLGALVPRNRESEFAALWNRMGNSLHHWIGGILVVMTVMGSFTALGLWIIGVQNWFLLGVLTFFGTFVPYIGAILSAVPGLLIALSQSNQTFFAACGVYFAVHILEGYIVDPMVMRRAVVIQPAMLLLWQISMATLFGLPGVILATPMYVCLKSALDELYVKQHLGKTPYPPESPLNPSRGFSLDQKKTRKS